MIVIKDYYGENMDLTLKNEDETHFNTLAKLSKSELIGRIIALRKNKQQ